MPTDLPTDKVRISMSADPAVLPTPPARIVGGNAPRRIRLVSLAWLVMLVVPLSDALGRTEPARSLGIVALAVFALLYGGTFLAASRTSQRRDAYLVVIQIALGVALFVAYGNPWWTPLLFSGASAIFLLPWRSGVPTLLAINVFGIVGAVALGWPWADVGDLVVTLLLSTAILLTVARLVRVIRELRLTQQALANAAVADERLRFSRDLHDLLGHTLSTIAVKSELATRLLPVRPEQAADELADIETLARCALSDVRETVSGYRDLSLAAELDGARAALAAGGVRCTVQPADRAMPGRVEAVLAWGVREAATNVLRHANAGSCSIVLAATDGVATLDVLDDGAHHPGHALPPGDARPPTAGTGLAGLGERVAAVGGRVVTGRVPSGGFRVHVEVPVS